jgi:phospholipid/cholesterol/gamma-HCH transport system substrate-binding protein
MSALRGGRLIALLMVAAVVAAGATLLLRDSEQTQVVAWFERTDGVYAGDEVRVLGVPVGTITSIEPQGGKVRVEMSIDDGVDIPASAKAALVAPSLVSSRYVQLAPRYDGGATMQDGDSIPIERTAVPVEWDEIKAQLNDISVALGPRGANKDGALGRLVDSGAAALDGQGATINQTIAQLGAAIETLDAGGDDAFSTVRNLQVFVSALARSDTQIAEFTERLDAVSGVLADDRMLVRTALRDLGLTVGKVGRFVRDNRGALKQSLTGLADVTSVVARQQDDLAQILHVAPNALANLIKAYHQRQNAVAVDLHAANTTAPGALICGAVGGATGSSAEQTGKRCDDLVGDLLDQAANSPQTQQLLQALLTLLAQS